MNENRNHQAGSDRQLLDEHRDCPERFKRHRFDDVSILYPSVIAAISAIHQKVFNAEMKIKEP